MYTATQSVPLLPSRSPFRARDSHLSGRSRAQGSNNREENRWSHFTKELDNMWTYKPSISRSSSKNSQASFMSTTSSSISANDNSMRHDRSRASTSTLLPSFSTQLLISQAILDSNDYSIISFQKLENLRQELVSNQEHISHIRRNLDLENRIHKIAKTLDKFNHNNVARDSSALQQYQHRFNTKDNEASRKIKYLTDRLEQLTQRQIDIQVIILKHTAAALNKGIQLSTNPPSPTMGSLTGQHQQQPTLNTILRRIDHLCKAYNISIVPSANTVQKLYQLQNYLSAPQAMRATDERKKQRQLAILNREKKQLVSKLIKIEQVANRLLSQITHYPEREQALQIELLQYKSEAIEIKLVRKHKEKDREVEALTIALKHREQQQTHQKLTYFTQELKARANDYQQHIREQASWIQSKNKQSQELKEKCRQLSVQNSKLDRLVRDKARELDERDNKMTQLSDELRYCQQQKQVPSDYSTVNVGTVAKRAPLAPEDLHEQFQKREKQWQTHTDMLQHESDELLNQFDVLTNRAMEFDTTRMKYDRQIDHLTQHIRKLEVQLIDERVSTLGHQQQPGGGGGQQINNTVALRKEFRMLVAHLKQVHQQKMEKEASEIEKLKSQLYELRHEQQSTFSRSTMEKKQCSSATQT